MACLITRWDANGRKLLSRVSLLLLSPENVSGAESVRTDSVRNTDAVATAAVGAEADIARGTLRITRASLRRAVCVLEACNMAIGVVA